MNPHAREVRVLTLQYDHLTGHIDDAPLRAYLQDRELLRSKPRFCLHEGQPLWTVYVESRLRLRRSDVGTETNPPTNPTTAPASEPDPVKSAELAAAIQQLTPDDRARYGRIADWRRATSRRDGVPPFILLTNRQILDIVQTSPTTLAALGSIVGIGEKRVAANGHHILEVLHGPAQESRPDGRGAVRTVDGNHKVVDVQNPSIPATPAPHADGADRPADPACDPTVVPLWCCLTTNTRPRPSLIWVRTGRRACPARRDFCRASRPNVHSYTLCRTAVEGCPHPLQGRTAVEGCPHPMQRSHLARPDLGADRLPGLSGKATFSAR